MTNGKVKGASAELELAAILQGWAYETGVLISLTRNLEQSRGGGHDLVGLDWLAIECKRVEALNVAVWWAQTLRQAKAVKAIPFLAYRQNRKPWSFRVEVCVLQNGNHPNTLAVDMDYTAAKSWFQHEVYLRNKT